VESHRLCEGMFGDVGGRHPSHHVPDSGVHHDRSRCSPWSDPPSTFDLSLMFTLGRNAHSAIFPDGTVGFRQAR
jgi:hypothetical protein